MCINCPKTCQNERLGADSSSAHASCYNTGYRTRRCVSRDCRVYRGNTQKGSFLQSTVTDMKLNSSRKNTECLKTNYKERLNKQQENNDNDRFRQTRYPASMMVTIWESTMRTVRSQIGGCVSCTRLRRSQINIRSRHVSDLFVNCSINIHSFFLNNGEHKTWALIY